MAGLNNRLKTDWFSYTAAKVIRVPFLLATCLLVSMVSVSRPQLKSAKLAALHKNLMTSKILNFIRNLHESYPYQLSFRYVTASR